jgi:N-acetylmuramoyl-L-alanine amidase
MQKRKEIICEAKPTLVISVHMNKYAESTRRGAQVFFKDGDQLGKSLALNIQKSLNDMEQAVRTCDALKGDYYILNCTNYPSVIAECGFLSNPEDEALLVTDEYQDDLAYAIFKGAVGYLAENSFNYF